MRFKARLHRAIYLLSTTKRFEHYHFGSTMGLPASSCRAESITVIMRIQSHITSSRFWRRTSHPAQLLVALSVLLFIAAFWGSPIHAQNPDYPFLSFSPGPVEADSPERQAEGQEAAQTQGETALHPETETVTSAEPADPDQPLIGDAQLRLDRLQTSSGPYEGAPERLDALTTLGSLLQEQGDHEEAINHYEQAMQLVRVNEGLFSERQLPMQAAIIDSHLALGDYDKADDMQASRLHLLRQNYPENSDTRVAAEEQMAHWNIAYYLHNYLYRASPSTYSLTRQHSVSRIRQASVFRSAQVSPFEYSGMRSSGPPRSGRYLSSRTPRLNEAEEQFLKHFNSASGGQGLDSLKALLSTAYYRNLEVAYRLRYQDLFSEINPVNLNDAQRISRDTYQNGLDLIQQQLDRLSDTVNERDEVLLLQADWHLLFGYRGRADEAYAELHEKLADQLSGAELTQFFNPSAFVMLPTFVTHQYSPDALSEQHAVEGSGYLDTRLDINIDGSIRGVSITGTSPDTPDRLRILLRDYLDTIVARPPILNGVLTRSLDLPVRFHYKY